MFNSNLLENNNVTSGLLISLALLIVILGCILMRRMTANEHSKMLKAQSFALENPEKIEKMKLVDRSEVFCVVTLSDKSSAVIAYGVEAVRVYDKLILLNPKLG